MGLDEPCRKKCFRFEEMWLSKPSCGETIGDTWNNTWEPNPSLAILKKVARCEQELTQWSKHNFGHVRRELAEKKKMLVVAENEAITSGDNSVIRGLKDEINILLDREARMWCQRSRVLWLSKGDSNTSFFHSKATQRFKKNLIRGIKNARDESLTEHEEMGLELTKYYEELFTSSNRALLLRLLRKSHAQ